jgi:uncharacterized protein YwgA
MNRLQLATLLSWAGDDGLQGRKRLQKVVFFLQEAGCPLDCGTTLHHFGPYSNDVAYRCDEIVAAGLAEETGGPSKGNQPYVYKLKPETIRLVQKTPDPSMQRFEELGKSLMGENLWSLELGSTILFFYRQTKDWDDALIRACNFKTVSSSTEGSQAALALAKRIAEKPVS